MSGHTKGPWRVNRSTYFPDQNELRIKEYCWVGFGTIGDQTPVLSKRIEENEANARLIAAAPDLLSALKAVMLELRMNGGNWTSGMKTVRAEQKVIWNNAMDAIAKAEGGDK